jgi:hypothetical protein
MSLVATSLRQLSKIVRSPHFTTVVGGTLDLASSALANTTLTAAVANSLETTAAVLDAHTREVSSGATAAVEVTRECCRKCLEIIVLALRNETIAASVSTVAGSITYLSTNEQLNDGVAATADLARRMASKAINSPTLNSAWNAYGPSSATVQDVTLGLMKTLSNAGSSYEAASSFGTTLFSRVDVAQSRQAELEAVLKQRVFSFLLAQHNIDSHQGVELWCSLPLLPFFLSADSDPTMFPILAPSLFHILSSSPSLSLPLAPSPSFSFAAQTLPSLSQFPFPKTDGDGVSESPNDLENLGRFIRHRLLKFNS